MRVFMETIRRVAGKFKMDGRTHSGAALCERVAPRRHAIDCARRCSCSIELPVGITGKHRQHPPPPADGTDRSAACAAFCTDIMDSPSRLSGLTIALHWTVAAGVLGLIALGLYMVQREAWPLYHLHKSIGLLVFCAIIVRVLWRLKNGLPKPVRVFSRMEHRAAVFAHALLLLATLAMPLTGMLYSAASGHGFGIFGATLVSENHDPASSAVVPRDAQLSDGGQTAHGVIGYLLLALIALHVGGAMKHHFLDRDRTLLRMLGVSPKGAAQTIARDKV
jgi:cytochrome b561